MDSVEKRISEPNSRLVEEQICRVEKKIINELGLLPITTDPYFMKVWNHLLADEMMLEDLTRETLESAAVKASLAMQTIAEERAKKAECALLASERSRESDEKLLLELYEWLCSVGRDYDLFARDRQTAIDKLKARLTLPPLPSDTQTIEED